MLLRPEDAAARLQVSTKHIYQLIREGQLRAVRIGKRKGIRVSQQDLDTFLDGRVLDAGEGVATRDKANGKD